MNLAPGCQHVSEQMQLLGYAGYLRKEDPDHEDLPRILDGMQQRVQKMLEECHDLSGLLSQTVGLKEGDWREGFTDLNADPVLVRSWISVAIDIVNVMTVMDLDEEFDEFIARLWDYLKHYELPLATQSEEGMDDPVVNAKANMAVHVAYLSTGYGRHEQVVSDMPSFVEYMRRNFYAVLAHDRLELVAEFVDVLRQYGCNEQNDMQVRHGSRYLLQMYLENKRQWMPLIPSEHDIDMVMYPWTAISGLERRAFESADERGSYGAAFKAALKRGKDQITNSGGTGFTRGGATGDGEDTENEEELNGGEANRDD